jgi:peptidoglycan/LPS O-acetylase OafA/YrhL
LREGVRDEIGYIAPLAGVRGLAVLWVIAFHWVVLRGAAGIADPWIEALRAVPPLDALARNGYLGVDLFFLLSGFLLALPWYAHGRRGAPAPSARSFYLRRIRRIVPAYYLQLLLLFTLVMPLLHGRKYWRSDVWVDLWNGVAHGLFLHNTTPLTSGSLGANGALWTLAIEAQFYLLLPLAMPLFVRMPWRTAAIAIAAALAWQWDAAHDMRPVIDAYLSLGAHWRWPEAKVREVLAIQLPAFAAHFTLGIVLARAWLARRDREAGPGDAMSRLGIAIAAALLLAASLAGGLAIPAAFARMPAMVALAMLLWLAATARGRFAISVLGGGPLAFAGRVSYSAYLYHFPLLLLWNLYARGLEGWLALPAYLALLGAVAWTSWRWVEQPFITSASASPPRAP